MYKACEKHLKQGSSIYLFPEGTRSESGKMRKFKEGAFVLAKRPAKADPAYRHQWIKNSAA